MKYLAIIQARMSSSRLPGKVMKDIGGKTALERMLDRVMQSQRLDEVMVATTIGKEAIPIVKLCSGLGIRVFAGSRDDVLDRYYQAAKLIKPEYVVRLTSDCPLFDWRVLDDAVDALLPGSDDLAMLTESFPDGQDLEIVRFEVLERAWREALLASEREHVTIYIKNHPELFELQNYDCPLGNLNSERWTLDEAADLDFIRAVYNHFDYSSDFSMSDVLTFLDANPEIREINAGIIRNEGLLKSLANDCVVPISD